MTYLTLPIAIIVGSIGVYAERKFLKAKQLKNLDYLDKSLSEERRKKTDNDYWLNENNAVMEAAKLKLEAPSSLYLNTGRKSTISLEKKTTT